MCSASIALNKSLETWVSLHHFSSALLYHLAEYSVECGMLNIPIIYCRTAGSVLHGHC